MAREATGTQRRLSGGLTSLVQGSLVSAPCFVHVLVWPAWLVLQERPLRGRVREMARFSRDHLALITSEPANHSTPITGHRTTGQERPGGEQHVSSTATHFRQVPKAIADMCPQLVYLVVSISLRRLQSGPQLL